MVYMFVDFVCGIWGDVCELFIESLCLAFSGGEDGHVLLLHY